MSTATLALRLVESATLDVVLAGALTVIEQALAKPTRDNVALARRAARSVRSELAHHEHDSVTLGEMYRIKILLRRLRHATARLDRRLAAIGPIP